MNNDIDLRRLIGLLSYLKKSDDVESELDKDKDPPSGHAAGRRAVASRTDPVQRKLHEAYSSSPDQSFSPEALERARQAMSSRGSGTPGSLGTTSGTIPDVSSETPVGDDLIYVPEEVATITGKRGGHLGRKLDTPAGQERVVVTPDVSDTSDSPSLDFPTDEEREIIQWFKDEGYTLSELKQMVEDYTKPAPKRKETPIHHVIRSDSNDRISKSNESILLTLLDKFLYLKK